MFEAETIAYSYKQNFTSNFVSEISGWNLH